MTNTKFTPGPWSYNPWMQGPDEIENIKSLGLRPIRKLTNEGQAIVMAGDTRVALVDCQAEFKRGKGHETDCEERDANARLIAAAPDMLGVLQYIGEILSEHTLADRALTKQETYTLIINISSAISKATGAL